MNAIQELNNELVEYASAVAMLGKSEHWPSVVSLAIGVNLQCREKYANTGEIDPNRLRSLIDWICWSGLKGLTCDIADFSDRFLKR